MFARRYAECGLIAFDVSALGPAFADTNAQGVMVFIGG